MDSNQMRHTCCKMGALTSIMSLEIKNYGYHIATYVAINNSQSFVTESKESWLSGEICM